MKKQIMVAQPLCLCMLLVTLIGGCVNGDEGLAEKCSQEVPKVIPCLSFATGKATIPTKQCCDAATKIKESDPKCLCYMIQQTHNGNPQSKSMGIQEDKLLHLPSACNLKNATVTNCPKLLGLSPASPDAAIFANASLPATTNPTSTTDASSSSPPDSSGSMPRNPRITFVASAFLLVAFPSPFLFSILTL